MDVLTATPNLQLKKAFRLIKHIKNGQVWFKLYFFQPKTRAQHFEKISCSAMKNDTFSLKIMTLKDIPKKIQIQINLNFVVYLSSISTLYFSVQIFVVQ